MQINHTLTRDSGTVRGMHYQTPPYAEKKFVSCLTGEVWDVVIDIRRSSPTFLKWHAEVLSETNQRSMYIPEGFAHGFQTLSNNCQLVYLHSNTYEPEAEGALNALDPSINIDWPLEICQMSERDSKHQFIDALFAGVEVS